MRKIPIFPIQPRDKRPLIPGGCNAATSDLEVVRAWWQRWPQANIAAATGSKFWVLDVDGDGADVLARLELDNRRLPETSEVITSRGRHVYFSPHDGLRNSAGRVGPGIDVRGAGGYVLVPPSIHPSGHVYAWTGKATLATAPRWLLDLALPPQAPTRPVQSSSSPPPANAEAYVSAATVAELQALDTATDGQRNDALNRAAFSLAGWVKSNLLPEPWAIKQLESRAVSIGLSVAEARRTIGSAFQAAKPREVPQ